MRADALRERQCRRGRLQHQHGLARPGRGRRSPSAMTSRALSSSSIELSVTGPMMPRTIGSSKRVVPSILIGTPLSRSTATAAIASSSAAPATPWE